MGASRVGDAPLHIGPINLAHDKERKILLVLAIVGAGVGLFALAARKGKAIAGGEAPIEQFDGEGGAGGGAGGTSPGDILMAQIRLAELAIEHSAGYTFALDSNTLSHDIGSETNTHSGGGSISFPGFSIGGSSGSSSTETWDYTTSDQFSAGFSGTNLSEEEFALLIQQAQALATLAHIREQEILDAAQAKLDAHNPPAALPPKHCYYTPQGVLCV